MPLVGRGDHLEMVDEPSEANYTGHTNINQGNLGSMGIDAQLAKQKMQNALGMKQQQGQPDPNDPKYAGLAGRARFNQDMMAWKNGQMQQQQKPILARPMPTMGNPNTQSAPQSPTPQATPIAGLIQQMLGMNG